MPKLCVIYSRIIFYLQTFHRSLESQPNPGECRDMWMHCLQRGQWTTSIDKWDSRAYVILYRIQWVVATPSVIFFPDKTPKFMCNRNWIATLTFFYLQLLLLLLLILLLLLLLVLLLLVLLPLLVWPLLQCCCCCCCFCCCYCCCLMLLLGMICNRVGMICEG